MRDTPSKAAEPSPALAPCACVSRKSSSFARKSSVRVKWSIERNTDTAKPLTSSSVESLAASVASVPKDGEQRASISPITDEITLALFRAKSLGRQLSFSRRSLRSATSLEAGGDGDGSSGATVSALPEQASFDDEDNDPMFNPDIRIEEDAVPSSQVAPEPFVPLPADDDGPPSSKVHPKPLTPLPVTPPSGHDSDGDIILTPEHRSIKRLLTSFPRM